MLENRNDPDALLTALNDHFKPAPKQAPQYGGRPVDILTTLTKQILSGEVHVESRTYKSHYKLTPKELIAYEKKYGKLTEWPELNTPGFYSKFADFLCTHRKMELSTARKRLQAFNKLLDIAVEKDLIQVNKLGKNPISQKDTNRKKIYLTAKDLEQLREYTPANEHESYARDVFLLGCYTGLRIGDIVTIDTPARVQVIDKSPGGYKCRVVIRKAGSVEDVAIPAKAWDILERWQFNFARFGSKRTSRTAIINRELKTVAKRAGLTRTELLVKKKRGTDNEHQAPPLWTLVTTHIARKTYGNRLVELKQATAKVSKAMHHSSEAITNDFYLSDSHETATDDLLLLAEVGNEI